jgi:hypothetical protein
MRKHLITVLVLIAFILGWIIWIQWRQPAPLEPGPGPEPSRAVGMKDRVPPSQPTGSQPYREEAPANTNARSSNPGQPDQDFLERIAAIPVPPEIVEAYLKTGPRSAQDLMAAFQASGDRKYLKEAAERYSDDPQVQFMVVATNLFPEERDQWIRRFLSSSPNNALGNYFEASEALRKGEIDSAVKALRSAQDKREFEDYTVISMHNAEAVYEYTGLSMAESKTRAMLDTQMPHLQRLRQLGREIDTLRQSMEAQGLPDLGDELVMHGLDLARRLSIGQGGRSLMNQLVGIRMEEQILEKLDPQGDYPFLNNSLEAEISAMQSQYKRVRNLASVADQLLGSASERQVIDYFERLKLFGELEAIAWLQGRQKPR